MNAHVPFHAPGARLGLRATRAAMAILATLAMAFTGLTAMPAEANAAAPDANLNVALGAGAAATKTVTLDQQDVRDNALKAVVKWRQDAYDDPAITIGGLAIPQYLAKFGVSKEQYLSPQWSNALERIAILRAVESSYTWDHQRMNPSSIWSATVDGEGSSAEILAWGTSGVAGAIDLWASEKSEYVKEVNGENHGETGHYTTLIDPGYRAYGFGLYGTAAAGEATADTPSNTAYTNLKGDYRITIGIGSDWDPTPRVSVHTKVAIGHPVAAHVFVGVDGSMEYDVTWSSSDSSVVAVSGGSVTGVSEGSATLTGTLSDGRKVEVKVSVTRFTDVNADSPHAQDVIWLADQGITKGFDDGSFGGMRDVVRQDMAAFLYRLAGSPEFTPTAGDKAKFNDVQEGSSHAKEIWWLASKGIAKGFDDGSFGGMRTVVRQDMAAFLHRYALNVAGTPGAGAGAAGFSDVTPGSPHADDVLWLAANGVTQGYPDGTFGGMRTVVRQDMAAFLHRMDTNVLK